VVRLSSNSLAEIVFAHFENSVIRSAIDERHVSALESSPYCRYGIGELKEITIGISARLRVRGFR